MAVVFIFQGAAVTDSECRRLAGHGQDDHDVQPMSDYAILKLTHDIGDDRLKVIAQIVVRFGHLERVLAFSIKRADERAGGTMTLAKAEELAISVGELAKKAEESYQKLVINQHLKSDFKKLMESAHKVARRRNDVVHGHWGKDEDGLVRWQRKGKSKDIDMHDLELLRDDIGQLVEEINQKHPTGLGGDETSATGWSSMSGPPKK